MVSGCVTRKSIARVFGDDGGVEMGGETIFFCKEPLFKGREMTISQGVVLVGFVEVRGSEILIFCDSSGAEARESSSVLKLNSD